MVEGTLSQNYQSTGRTLRSTRNALQLRNENFPSGWGKRGATKHFGKRHSPQMVKALTFYFWTGLIRGQTYTNRAVYDLLLEHIRRQELPGPILEEKQIKSWMAIMASKVKKSPEKHPQPLWIDSQNPACMWE